VNIRVIPLCAIFPIHYRANEEDVVNRGCSFKTVYLFISIITGYILYSEAFAMDAIKISSAVFAQNASIPAKYTCDGSDVSPPLMIENVPLEAKSLALIVDDPDAPAGTWVHWVVWNLDPATKEIKENMLPPGAQEGMNDFRKRSYGGPCPPGGTHRYFFKLYALDTVMTLGPNTTKALLEQAMRRHIVAQSELIGRYKRR
jgi:Raf kinase inhibitor-like YbhB/YbcL family protein